LSPIHLEVWIPSIVGDHGRDRHSLVQHALDQRKSLSGKGTID